MPPPLLLPLQLVLAMEEVEPGAKQTGRRARYERCRLTPKDEDLPVEAALLGAPWGDAGAAFVDQAPERQAVGQPIVGGWQRAGHGMQPVGGCGRASWRVVTWPREAGSPIHRASALLRACPPPLY
jgi:hypothetical protein